MFLPILVSANTGFISYGKTEHQMWGWTGEFTLGTGTAQLLLYWPSHCLQKHTVHQSNAGIQVTAVWLQVTNPSPSSQHTSRDRSWSKGFDLHLNMAGSRKRMQHGLQSGTGDGCCRLAIDPWQADCNRECTEKKNRASDKNSSSI